MSRSTRRTASAHEVDVLCRLIARLASAAHRLGEGEKLCVHAEAVFTRRANKGLGVDCSGEVHMQVSPFGHLVKKARRASRALFSGLFEGAGRTGFCRGFMRRRCGLRMYGLRQQKCKNKRQQRKQVQGQDACKSPQG